MAQQPLLAAYEGQGIYLTWERQVLTGVDHYRIMRGTHLDASYTSIDTVNWPDNEYIDQVLGYGISNFYKIQEEDVNDTVLATSQPMWGEDLLLRASLAYEMDPFMRLPVYMEELYFTNDERNKGYVASWGAWDYFQRPRLYISRAPMSGSNYTTFAAGSKDAYMVLPQRGTTNLVTQVTSVGNPPTYAASKTYSSLEWYPDYNGNIYFVDSSGQPVSIDWYDNILVDYQFQVFSPKELNDALFLAAGDLISRPGIGKGGRAESYGTIGNMPRRWDYALVAGASFWLLRRLSLMLLQRERRLVFLDPDGKVPDLSNLMESYKTQFADAAKVIPIESFPLIGINVTPSYQLPGQRSRFFRMSFKGY